MRELVALGAIGAGLFLAMRADEVGPGSDVPRGIRNNNPGNLENNGTPWQGLAERQTDPRFYQFESPVWGIRALARTLKTYRERYGLNTAVDIISRWAPPHENDTASYARAVARALGTDPYTYISDSPETRLMLVKAIIRHENGIQPYPDDLIIEGIRRAYT
jgi:hypothetical protein